MKVVSARESNISQINQVIFSSKAHWNYSSEYLNQALKLICIDEAYLRENLSFELLNEIGDTVGFFSIAEKHEERYLDNLWIDPAFHKKGYGTLACLYVDKLAYLKAWPELFVLPDPPAEMFYLKQGFYDTGKRVVSRILGGPMFSVFKKKFSTHIETIPDELISKNS
jgi:hypothetical protein